MSAAGYEAAVPLSAIDGGKIPGQYLFFNPQLKLIVELHNDLTLRYFPRRLPLEDFSRGKSACASMLMKLPPFRWKTNSC